MSEDILVAGKLSQPSFSTRIDEEGNIVRIAPEFPDLPKVGFSLDLVMELERENSLRHGLDSYLAFKAVTQEQINWAQDRIAECDENIRNLENMLDAKKRYIDDQQFFTCCIDGKKFAATKGFVWSCSKGEICFDCMEGADREDGYG